MGEWFVYQLPLGGWGAFAAGTISGTFETREAAERWARRKVEKVMARLSDEWWEGTDAHTDIP